MEQTKRGISYKWITIMVVATGTFMETLDFGMVRIALPHLADVFQVGPNTIVWLMLLYMLVSTGLMLTLGHAGDKFGRKRLYTIGLAIFSLGLGLSSIAQGFLQLIVFRLIQACGVAITLANGYAIVTASFPTEERGRALGIMGAVVGAGLLSGPAIGGFLLDFFDWRAIFYLRLPIGIIAVILAWILLKEPFSTKQKGKIDLTGAITIFITLACLLVAVNQGQSLGWTSPLILVLYLATVLSLSLFIFQELRVAEPVLDLKLYKTRLFSIASGSHVLTYIASAGMDFLLPFYLIQGLSFSASKSGLILVTIPALYVLMSPLAGRLSDKLGTISLCTMGLTLVSIGFLLLSGLGTDATAGDIVWRLLIVGIGMGLFVSPNTSAIMGSVSRERLGTASAMVGTLRQIGMSTGMAIAGTAFTASQLSNAAQLTSQGFSEDIVKKLSTLSGFRDAIFVAMVFAIAGAIVSVLRGRRKS